MSRLLRASEIGPVFGVDAKTIIRWARVDGFPPALTTPSGQHRWKSEDVAAVARERGFDAPADWTSVAA